MSNLGIAATLYLVSLIPWAFSFFIKDRQAQWSLGILDMILTWGSYLYFSREYGWWVLVFIGTNWAVGSVLAALGFMGYDNLTDKTRAKASW